MNAARAARGQSPVILQRDEPLRGRLFVSGRAVDLPRLFLAGQINGTKETGQPLRLQASIELRRLNEVVLDRVRRSKHHGILETRQRVDDFALHVARQAHREAVDVGLVDIDAFGLQKDLVPLALGKPHDLVFERRAVAWANPADLAVEQRRPADVRSHDGVHALGRIQHVAGHLRALDPAGHERKRHDRIVAEGLGET